MSVPWQSKTEESNAERHDCACALKQILRMPEPAVSLFVTSKLSSRCARGLCGTLADTLPNAHAKLRTLNL